MDTFYTGTSEGSHRAGWHFLQLPGPTNIPQRILNATAVPAIDHRGEDFAELALGLFDGVRKVFKTRGEVFMFPSSGTGAWEAAIVNTLSPGDGVLMFDSGQFSYLWIEMAKRFGLNVDVVDTNWRCGPDPEMIATKLADDKSHDIKAVMVVHNETSTGVTARIEEIRAAMNSANHPALLFVDTISSLGCMDYRHDEWGVDVSIGGSQKGLMLPPGLSFNAVSEKAVEASKTAKMPRCYWDWQWMRENNATGFFPYTPAIQLLYGLRESISMLGEEGLENVFKRHHRLGTIARAAVEAWGLDTVCENPKEHSNSVTAVLVPAGHDADAFRKIVLEKFNMALGGGLNRYAGKIFRIGHMGHCNDLMLASSLTGVEAGLSDAGIPHISGGARVGQSLMASGNTDSKAA